jgi:hypothetical protein
MGVAVNVLDGNPAPASLEVVVVPGTLDSGQGMWLAMTRHGSQLVWYRRLFLLFSSYAYASVLEPLVV